MERSSQLTKSAAAVLVGAVPPVCSAEGLMYFGPSEAEAFWLFQLPLFAAAAIALFMLFKLKAFLFLVGGLCVVGVYAALGVGLLSSAVGAFMLLFLPWVAFAVLAFALWLGLRASVTAQPRV